MGIHRRYSAPLLAFFLSGTAFATERVAVDPYIKAGPGYTAATGSVTGYVPTKPNADLLLEAERKGWLGSGSAKTPVTVKPKVTVPVGGLTSKLKAGLKTNAGQLALGAAVSGAVAAVGWVMSDDNTKIQKKDAVLSDGTPLASTGNTGDPQQVCNTYPASQVLGKIITTTYQNVTYAVATFPRTSSNVWTGPSGYTLAVQNCTKSSLGYTGSPYFPSSYAKVISIGDIGFKKTDLAESDWAVLDPWIASQSATWLKGLLSEVCGGTYGGVNPQACYDGLQKQSAAIISGPATVQGPQTTSTGTYTRADGTTGTTSSTTNTTYNITYGDQFFDYTTNTTTTNTKDGQVTDTNTTTDAGTPQETLPKRSPTRKNRTTSSRIVSFPRSIRSTSSSTLTASRACGMASRLSFKTAHSSRFCTRLCPASPAPVRRSRCRCPSLPGRTTAPFRSRRSVTPWTS